MTLRLFGFALFAYFAAMIGVSADDNYSQCHKWGSPGQGNLQQAQLWNPSDSGVQLKVNRVHVHSNVDAAWNLIATNEAFPELRNPGHSTHIHAAGKVAGTGELRGLVNQDRGEHQYYSLYVWSASAGEQLAIPVNITVDPGWGLAIASRNLNAPLAACFDWSERSE